MIGFGKRALTRRAFVRSSAATTAAASLSACANGTSPTKGGADDQAKDASAQPKQSKVAILHTNDTHGYDLRNDESLGMAAVAQLKVDWEAKGYEVLLLDAGDAVQGSNLVNRSSGDVAIEFMNLVGYDAMALGNHEFDFGQDKIEDYSKAATFPLLSSNVIVDKTGDTLVDANTILTLADGRKVGVFALTTPETYTKSNPLYMQGLTIYAESDLYACAQRQVNELRDKGCDLVVCLGHLGESDNSNPNRAKDVIKNISGLDLFINGHDHVEESQELKDADGNKVLVVEAGCYTHLVGVVTWEDGTLASQMIRPEEYDGQEPEVAAAVQRENDAMEAELSEVIATTPFLLNGEAAPGVLTQETNLSDLIADAILWQAQQTSEDTPDLALISGGSIRASVQEGDITQGDVLDVLPYLNRICTIRLKGSQLLEALEAGCCVAPKKFGGFPQVSGIEFAIDTSVEYKKGDKYPNSTYYAPADPGSRITISTINGKAFDEGATYTVASTDFLCYGGDTYHAFLQAANRTLKSTDCIIADSVIRYLQEPCGGEVPPEYAEAQGRISVT